MNEETRTRRYQARTREETWNALQRDAADAAAHGWTLTSQRFDGDAVVANYRFTKSQWAAPTPVMATTGPANAPSSGLFLPSVAVAIAGILVAVGSALPWVQVGMISASGLQGDGFITIAIGVALILIGLAGAVDQDRGRRLRIVAALGGLAALGVGLYYVSTVSGSTFTMLDTEFERQAGAGLYMVAIGGLIALVAAIRTQASQSPYPVAVHS